MGWNGSQDADAGRGTHGGDGKAFPCSVRRSVLHGLVAGLVVVIVGVGVYFIIGDRTEQQQVAEKAPRPKSTIREVAPAVVTNKTVVAAPVKRERTDAERGIYTDEKGVRRFKGGARVPVKATHTATVGHYIINGKDINRQIFKYPCESTIGMLVTIEPGTYIDGNRTFDARFEEDFKASLNDKIEITKEDDEEDREKKLRVIEAKKELEAAMRRGESVAAIMQRTFDEYKALGDYRESLRDQLKAIQNDESYSSKDFDDFVTAANQMLTEKGSKPIGYSPIMKRMLERTRARRAQKAATSAAGQGVNQQ